MYKTEAFYSGEGFYRVACGCVPDDYLDNEEDDCLWFVPYIVNLAFACELFLKSLLSNENDTVWGHRLDELFCRLDDSIKNQILHSASFNGDEEFLLKLQETGNCFVDWRYYFDKNIHASVDIPFLERLTGELYLVAKNHISDCTSA